MDNAGNQSAGKPQAAAIRYVDQPELHETFADSINNVFFDGQTMRIEFGITRMDEMKQGQQLSGRRYPACRLVLPLGAALDLINKMQQTANAMQQAGLLKPAAAAAAAEPKPAASARSSLVDKLAALEKSAAIDKPSVPGKPSIFDKPSTSEK